MLKWNPVQFYTLYSGFLVGSGLLSAFESLVFKASSVGFSASRGLVKFFSVSSFSVTWAGFAGSIVRLDASSLDAYQE